MYLCLHACVCCCWIREVKDVNNERKLQQNCTNDTWYKKRILKIYQDGDHCPLTFSICKAKPASRVTWLHDQPRFDCVLTLCQSVSQWVTVSADASGWFLKPSMCSLPSEGACLSTWECPISCDVLVQPVHGAAALCRWTSCNWILLLYHSILIRAFFFFFFFLGF